MDIVKNADTDSLTKGYSTFASEVNNIDPNYSPLSVKQLQIADCLTERGA